jgi:spore coat polysaccharide biosynthesis protein SpsF
LSRIARQENVFCYRGSEDDVLVRLHDAASEYKIDFIVNLTADCPLIDPIHIESVIKAYKRTHADHITASRLPTGQGLWGIDVEALRKVCEIKDETETEVWGEYFTKSGFFKVHELEVDPLYEHPTLKTSLDYPEDYTFLQRVFRELYVAGSIFSLKDILKLIREKPEISSINSHCRGLGVQHVLQTATPMRLRESGKEYGNNR